MNVSLSVAIGIIFLIVLAVGMTWKVDQLLDQRRILKDELAAEKELTQSNCEREFLNFVRMIVAIRTAPRGTQVSLKPFTLVENLNSSGIQRSATVNFDTFDVSGFYYGIRQDDPFYRITANHRSNRHWSFGFEPASPAFPDQLNEFYELCLAEKQLSQRGGDTKYRMDYPV